MRLSKLISYEETERRFEEHQNQWSENIFNEDAKNKYVIPLTGTKGDNYLEMLQGSKAQQRKWWLYNRFKYMDSKYNAGDAVKDFIQFRAYVDSGVEKPNITITPYADIYATVSYANGRIVAKRAKRNEQIIIENPFGEAETENDQETYIYSASQLKSIGDISGFHPDTVKIGNATKLQDLKVGDNSPDYSNPYLKELTVGNNTLLKTLDARNCVNLGTGVTTTPDLSKCINIEEIYFTGTKIKGITLPDGGNIKKLHLPGTLTSLTIKNQPLLTDLSVEGTNTTLSIPVENPDTYTIIGKVISMTDWSEQSELTVADGKAQIKLLLTDKDLYDSIILNETSLVISCTTIEVRYDLITDEVNGEVVTLVEQRATDINTIALNSESLELSVKSAIDFALTNVKAPTKEDYGTSLIEALWLENIPAESIKSEFMVSRMKPNTAVRLIGINETYQTVDEIKRFYGMLDTKKGLTADGETVDKAQVTGKIYVPDIPYADYVELSAKYPEVAINTDAVVCTVNFINEGKLYATQNINQGSIFTSSSIPSDPTKSGTQQYYYTFNKWITDEEKPWDVNEPITRNMTITATYDTFVQQYKVTYQTDSNIITVNPAEIIVYYGDFLKEPEISGIPDGVTFLGWYTPDGTRWQFSPESGDKVLDHLNLTAKWSDANKPTVIITRKNYNTFSYKATDNLGISGYTVTYSPMIKEDLEAVAPETWTEISPKTTLVDDYTISAAGTYWLWITDKAGNTIFDSIIAYPISIEMLIKNDEDNIHAGLTTQSFSYSFSEGETEFTTNFALSGTHATINIDLDSHYKDLSILINDEPMQNHSEYVINQPIEFKLTCSPQKYFITFITGKEDDGAEVAKQEITYLYKASLPLPLYNKGYIINNWYKDSKLMTLWNFDINVVEESTTLYAEWQEYRTPTRIKIKIPHSFEEWEDRPRPTSADYETDKANYDPYAISVNYTQARANDVKIYFGDNSGEFSSSATTSTASVKHVYAEAGEYTIEIYGTPHGYALGGSYSAQTVDPACCITDIEFAWDLTTTGAYAFRGAQIKELKLTPYMTSIAASAFSACRNLKTINIPSSISKIGADAFKDCDGLVGTIVIPKTISEVGSDVFTNCLNIDEIVFEEGGILQEIGTRFANHTGIKRLDVPAYIHHIKSDAFGNCGQLTKVILRHPDLTLEEFVFNSTFYLVTAGPIEWDKGAGNSLKYNIEYAWTEKIPDYAFSARTNFRQSYLDSITFPKDLKEIGFAAFRGASLEANDLVFPAPTSDTHFLTIGEEAFYNTDLVDLDLPAHIRSVGKRAFGENYLLSTAILRFPTSSVKINAASDSWFLRCKPKDGSEPKLMPKIPRNLAADSIALAGAYGIAWNFYDDNPDTDPETGKPRKLSYAGLEN